MFFEPNLLGGRLIETLMGSFSEEEIINVYPLGEKAEGAGPESVGSGWGRE